MDRVSSAGLSIARELYDFVNSEALPGTGLEPDAFWSGLAAILAELVDAVSRVAEGDTVFTPGLAGLVVVVADRQGVVRAQAFGGAGHDNVVV